MTTSRDLVAKHANGALNATQIAELTGLTAKNVRKIAKRYNLLIACAELGRQPLIAESVVRDLAAKGMTTREMAEALARPVLTVRNTARKYKIKVRRPPPPNNLPKRPAKPVPPPALRPQSVEEWIAIHGAPKRFEPGTLDQILMDTFASVGKELTHSAGAGTSWTPYKLGRKAMNKGQAIAEANKIREAQGKPLLAIPRRPSPSTASRGIKFGSGVVGRVG
jgi:hypothetical protein